MTLRFETLPPTTNHIYGRGGRGVYLLPNVRTAKEALAWEARSQVKGPPMTGSLSVAVTLYWGDRRKHDIDNIKILLDAMTDIVWEDDGQIVDLELHKRFDKERPRVEMTVSYA